MVSRVEDRLPEGRSPTRRRAGASDFGPRRVLMLQARLRRVSSSAARVCAQPPIGLLQELEEPIQRRGQAIVFRERLGMRLPLIRRWFLVAPFPVLECGPASPGHRVAARFSVADSRTIRR